MSSALALRDKLGSLLDNYKKLKHESALLDDDIPKRLNEKTKMEEFRTTKFGELMMKEKKLEETVTKLHDTNEKLFELEKSSLECKKSTDILLEKIKMKDSEIEMLQDKTEQAKSQAIESAHIYSQTLTKLRELQNANERIEKQEETLKKLIAELDSEKLAVQNSTKKLQLKQEQSSERQRTLDKLIQELTERVESANKRTVEAEDVCESLGLELAMLAEEADDWAQKGRGVMDQLDELRVSLQAG